MLQDSGLKTNIPSRTKSGFPCQTFEQIIALHVSDRLYYQHAILDRYVSAGASTSQTRNPHLTSCDATLSPRNQEGRHPLKDDFWPREKKWRDIATRSRKIHRAKQLGETYPRISESQLIEKESLNVLFVCSMNQWRSPTAEKIYADKALVNTRSAGTSKSARRSVNSNDLKWADVVLVMEPKHKQRLKAQFPGELKYKELHVLDIPDEYKFMDPELIAEITKSVDPIVARVED